MNNLKVPPAKSTKPAYTPAHNGLVAGSSPAGPTKEIRSLFRFCSESPRQKRPASTTSAMFSNSQTNVALRTGLGPSHFNR
jgi:hypothetical protein